MTRCACLVLVLFGLSAAQPVRIVPQDVAAGDASFVAFRAELRVAAEACNESVLWSFFAEEVYGPEGSQGLKQVRAYFEAQRTDRERQQLTLCGELARALTLGTAPGVNFPYCAPYVLCWWSLAVEEGNGFTAGPEIAVRRYPNGQADVVDTLSYEVIAVCHYVVAAGGPCSTVDDSTPGWYAVVSPRGKVGYVRHNDVLVPNGNYHFGFARRSQGWRVVSVDIYE